MIELTDRETVREALACSLIRSMTQRPTFDGLFDLWFPVAQGEREAAAGAEVPRKEDGTPDMIAVRRELAEAIADPDGIQQERMRELAAQAVEQFGRYNAAGGPSFSAYQTLQAIQPELLISKIIAGLTAGPDSSEFDVAVARGTARNRVQEFRDAVADETRRRVAERVGRVRVATYGVNRQAEDADFLRISDKELADLRRGSQRLARVLAARLSARRRRARRGEIDLRKTLRKSMSTGGVPIKLAARKPRPGRPDLVLLCDISGSVAGFSGFTMLLVSTLREQFSRVRIFAFVDRVDEVTHLFTPDTQLDQVTKRIFTETNVMSVEGHSDYGRALADFARDFPDAITDKTALLILGDGRTNYRDPSLAALRELSAAAKHAHWLNPEAEKLWGTGDSAAMKYADIVEMHECRTARQLTELVGRLLPV